MPFEMLNTGTHLAESFTTQVVNTSTSTVYGAQRERTPKLSKSNGSNPYFEGFKCRLKCSLQASFLA